MNMALSRETVGLILKNWLGKAVKCRSIERLHGGMINSVLAIEFDHPPYQAVIKISDEEGNPFEREAYALNYLWSNSQMPVPEVYLYKPTGEIIEQGFILMERLSGVNLGSARMTYAERHQVDQHLAEILIELHGHKRDVFGELDGSVTYNRWLEWFEPAIRENFEDTGDRLTKRSMDIIPNLMDMMPQIFESQGEPTLVHGDIWATNVMVDRPDGRWKVTGLIDPTASRYADVEFELAYLQVFGTVTDVFFEHYCRIHPLRKGYEVRRLYYWLNTLLLHVWLFGDAHYVMRTERIAEELNRLM